MRSAVRSFGDGCGVGSCRSPTDLSIPRLLIEATQSSHMQGHAAVVAYGVSARWASARALRGVPVLRGERVARGGN